VAAAAVILLLPLVLSSYPMSVAVTVVTYAILGLGLNVVVGYAGLLDLGYAAFFAIGAYTSSLLQVDAHLSFWETLPAAVAAAAVAGCVIGYPTLRLRSDYLAIVTLGFGEIVRITVTNLSFTGGPNGLYGISPASAFGVSLTSEDALYYLGLHEAQAGDSRAALKRWQELEAKSPPDAPYLPVLRAEIARVAKGAGLEMPQPSREQQQAMAAMTPEQRQQAIRGMVEGLAAKMKENPQDRAGWLRLANAWKVLGENANAADAYAKADALGPVDARLLADWAETHVRGLAPGQSPSPQAIAVLERLEKAEPRNGLALFYLGAAAFAAGDKPAAAQRWKTLLTLLPPDAPIRAMLEQRIKETEAKSP